MKVLFITNDFAGASLCRRLADEGNQVQAVVAQASCRSILDGVVGKAASLTEGLAWAGRESLIVVDEHGFGVLQDELRAAGHAVVGGCAGADRMEEDRPYCQDLLKVHGLLTLPTRHFPTVPAAIDFLTEQRGRWVLKQNGYPDKSLCYAGRLESAEDLLDLLRGFAARGHADSHIILQQRADGVEIGVARYFNGRDWLGPVEMNIEHKKLFPGDLGPNTCEMGTLMWFDEADGNRLFNEVLAPLAPHLRAIGFHGDIDVNCIVNDHGAWPLEVTPRFGYPATQCQMELFTSNWTGFLLALAQGHDFDPPWRRGYAVAALAALPPFPYRADNFPAWMSPQGLKVRFRNTPNPEELRHYHFEEASLMAIADYWLVALCAAINIALKALEVPLLYAFIGMWLIDIMIAGVFLAVYAKTGHDISLGEDLRRATDAMHKKSKIAGYLSMLSVIAQATFWSGPEQVVIFFRKEIGCMPRMVGGMVFLSAIQAAAWMYLYRTGYDLLA